MNTVKEKHVLAYGARCITFRKRGVDQQRVPTCFLVINKKLEAVSPYHDGNRLKYRLLGQKMPVHSVLQSIRLLYDHDGVLIARRASPKAPLRFTGKGQSKRLLVRK